MKITVKNFSQLTSKQKDKCTNTLIKINGADFGSQYHNDLFYKLNTRGQKVKLFDGFIVPVNIEDFKPENLLKIA